MVKNLSVTAGGYVTTTAFTFSSTVTAVCAGILIRFTRHYKYFVTAGACIYTLGIGLIIKYRTPDTSVATLVGCQIVIGIGGGLVNVPSQLGVQASASHQEVAAATAIFLTILEVGGAVVWTSSITSKLTRYLPADAKSQASFIAGSYEYALKYENGTPERIAINRAFQETMNILLIIAVCVCIPLIPLSLTMKNYKLGNEKTTVQDDSDGVRQGEPARRDSNEGR